MRKADLLPIMKDAFKHCKVIAASGDGRRLLETAGIPIGGPDDDPADPATVVGDRLTRPVIARFVKAMADHRLWTREPRLHLPG